MTLYENATVLLQLTLASLSIVTLNNMMDLFNC